MFDRGQGGEAGRCWPDLWRVLADRIRARDQRMRADEVGAVRDVMEWLELHSVDPTDPMATGPAGGVGRQAGSDGTPLVDKFASLEYAALRDMAPPTARAFLLDVADLVHRFPKLFRAVMALWIPIWQARKILVACRQLSREAAIRVDAEIAASLGPLADAWR